MIPAWWRSPQFWVRVGRFATALTIALMILRFLWWANTPIWLWFGLLLLAIAVLTKVGMFEGTWRGWFKVKLREWSTDLRQLWMWARLAFKPKRDDQDVAAMAHQARFLDGRTLSPVNIFTYLPLILGVLGVLTIGVDQWRIDRVKKERDAPCSARELTQRSDGEYRTSRASCAQLGATNEVAREWMELAEQAEAQRDAEVTRIRDEMAATIARQQAEAQRRQALAARQRRRENEGIEAALGGGAPDLERSLCELAGRADCGPPSGADSAPVAPAPAIVPDAAARADGQ
jgi:hypothetical protein